MSGPQDADVASAAPVTALQKRADGFMKVALPLAVAVLSLVAWDAGVRISRSDVFPKPLDVARGIVELVQKGLLLKYVVASLFRVSIGFTLAVSIGIPFGLFLGWFARALQAFNPMIQMLRPI